MNVLLIGRVSSVPSAEMGMSSLVTSAKHTWPLVTRVLCGADAVMEFSVQESFWWEGLPAKDAEERN